MTAASRAQAMLAARARDSQDKRQRALAAVQALEAAGTPVTATTVATAAGISTWLAYADGVREHVEAARQRQAERGHVPGPAAPPVRGAPVTQVSLRTELAVARDEIRRLRAERDKLRGRLRLQLGAEIEGPDRAELLDHRNLNVTRCYYRNPQELHQPGEKPQVSRSHDCGTAYRPS